MRIIDIFWACAGTGHLVDVVKEPYNKYGPIKELTKKEKEDG